MYSVYGSYNGGPREPQGDVSELHDLLYGWRLM